ncbi:hypothetical protein JW933_07940 [candidate division FCPU426 bacterium]|nr:hypothetical protein [candidate division FCPU426 bacterium]
MKKAILPMLVFAMALMTGCAHVYHARVDAINDGRMSDNKTYIIVPGNANTAAGDLQFREFARYLQRALQQNGFIAASENTPPDVEIYLSYGIGNPRPRIRTYTVPVWGQTNTEITTTESTHKTQTGVHTTTTTDITPEYGVTGYTTQDQVLTVYPKYVEIDAYSIKNAKPGDRLEQLWKTTIRSEGKKNEIRSVFPILMAAAAKYLGGNTGREIEVALTRNQPEVKLITGNE